MAAPATSQPSALSRPRSGAVAALGIELRQPAHQLAARRIAGAAVERERLVEAERATEALHQARVQRRGERGALGEAGVGGGVIGVRGQRQRRAWRARRR